MTTAHSKILDPQLVLSRKTQLLIENPAIFSLNTYVERFCITKSHTFPQQEDMITVCLAHLKKVPEHEIRAVLCPSDNVYSALHIDDKAHWHILEIHFLSCIQLMLLCVLPPSDHSLIASRQIHWSSISRQEEETNYLAGTQDTWILGVLNIITSFPTTVALHLPWKCKGSVKSSNGT